MGMGMLGWFGDADAMLLYDVQYVTLGGMFSKGGEGLRNDCGRGWGMYVFRKVFDHFLWKS